MEHIIQHIKTHCSHIFFTERKIYRRLQEDLSMEEFVMGEENFNEGGVGFSSII